VAPRADENGDFAVIIAHRGRGWAGEPIQSDACDPWGDAAPLPAFNETLLGMCG